MRPLYTPLVCREERGKERQAGIIEEKVPDFVPDLSKACAELGGKIMWPARGTRFDLLTAAGKIAQRYTCWTRQDDHLVYRVFQYLKATPSLGLGFYAAKNDIDNVFLYQCTDSDHANDVIDAKSTTGGWVAICSPNGTLLPIDAVSKKQTSPGLHTAECETVACHEVTMHTGLPNVSLLETLTGRDVRLIAEEDNQASIAAIRKGFSRRMAYMKKTQRVSLSSLHQIFFGTSEEVNPTDEDTINRLEYVDTHENIADIFTKGLDYEKHWYFLDKMGMIPAE